MSDLEEQRRKAEELKRKILEQKKKAGIVSQELETQVPSPAPEAGNQAKEKNHGLQASSQQPSYHVQSTSINPLQAYTNALRQALADGVISKDEDVLLSTLRKTLGINDEVHLKVLHSIYREIYTQALKAAWSDGKITEDDVERLEKLREVFKISAEEHLHLEKVVRQQLTRKGQ
ncbi:MAG: hypothetical protein N3A63_06205 [Bacteroidetes bacterium]|nr:hypothetical protein [Bacteroidota bacterium]